MAVAKTLLQKEEELKFITSPGRLPPKASVIASLRKEIASLRNQLTNPDEQNTAATENTVVGQSRLTKQLVGRNTKPKASTAPPKAASESTMRSMRKGSGARNALLLVEQQMSLGSTGGTGNESATSLSVSDKVKHALQMVERNISISEASKRNSLNEYETLQVENAILRTELENILEEKRRLEHLHATAVKAKLMPRRPKKEKRATGENTTTLSDERRRMESAETIMA